MFVEDLSKDQGMWFVFNNEQMRQFWMKNTLIPLDIIFVNSKLEVINIVHRAQPETLTPRRSKAPAQYVLGVARWSGETTGFEAGTLLSTCGLESP